jgi:hypothetical protein
MRAAHAAFLRFLTETKHFVEIWWQPAVPRGKP